MITKAYFTPKTFWCVKKKKRSQEHILFIHFSWNTKLFTAAARKGLKCEIASATGLKTTFLLISYSHSKAEAIWSNEFNLNLLGQVMKCLVWCFSWSRCNGNTNWDLCRSQSGKFWMFQTLRANLLTLSHFISLLLLCVNLALLSHLSNFSAVERW